MARTMKVAQLVPRMEVGGVERGTVEIARALVAAGHSAYVISAGGRLVAEIEKAGGRHITMPIGSKNALVAAKCISRLRAVIRSEGIEIVHARSRVPAWVGLQAAKGTRTHFVTTAHGFYRPHPLSRSMVMGEKVIAVSHPLKQYLMEKFGVPESRIVVIHRGVDVGEFRERSVAEAQAFRAVWKIPPDAILVGMVGRPSAVKGHPVFFAAIQNLSKVGLPVYGVVVGVESARAAASAGAHVAFVPPTPEVAIAYSAMDICVMSSIAPEAFGRTVIEAMACRRAVVASALGGVLDIIEDERNGLLFPAGDAAALAARLRRLVLDAALRSRLAEAGHQTVVEKFTLERYTAATLALYQELLAG